MHSAGRCCRLLVCDTCLGTRTTRATCTAEHVMLSVEGVMPLKVRTMASRSPLRPREDVPLALEPPAQHQDQLAKHVKAC